MKTITDQVTTLLESARQARENGQPLIKIGIDAHLGIRPAGDPRVSY